MVQGGPRSPAPVRAGTETPPPAAGQPAPAKPATPTATPAQPAQDLTRIQGIDAALADALGKLGITRYEQIAAWMRRDIERVEQTLGQPGRANRENWIEQAQILAKGGETRTRAAAPEARPPTPSRPLMRASAVRSCSRGCNNRAAALPPIRSSHARHLRRRGRGGRDHRPQAGRLARGCRSPPPRRVPRTPTTPPDVASRAAFAATTPTTMAAPKPAPDAAATTGSARAAEEPAVPIRPAPATAHDNLQRIGGIDAPDRAEPQRPGASRAIPDRALVARGRRAPRAALGTSRPHRARELDRAGANPEPRRRHPSRASSTSTKRRRPRSCAPSLSCPTPSASMRLPSRRSDRGKPTAAALPRRARLAALGALGSLPGPRARPRGGAARRQPGQGGPPPPSRT